MHKNYKQYQATNPDLCKKCGGACCKKSGCHFAPADFNELEFESLKNEIWKGHIAIDVIFADDWHGATDVFYLRVRNVGEPVVVVDEEWWYKNNPCILLAKTGCKIPFQRRPTGGKSLLPKRDKYDRYVCRQMYTRADCAEEWMEYQEILKRLVAEFRHEEVQCSI